MTRKGKTIIYLTDDDVILYKGASEKICVLQGSFEDSCPILEGHLEPKASLYLLIDRTNQNIHEEKLPPLPFWDRARFLFHKKIGCASQGGFASFRFLKEGKDFYLRWVHIPQDDPIAPWISWVKSRGSSVFFMALEAQRVFDKRSVSSKSYRMLQYLLPSQKTRHSIFKGNRLLLTRVSQEKEESQTSLHFLSRNYPDIHENIEILTPSFTFLIDSISSQKKSLLPLRSASFSKNRWVHQGMGGLLIATFTWVSVDVYKGIQFKTDVLPLLSEVRSFQKSAAAFKKKLSGTDVPLLRMALEQYATLQANRRDPLKDFKTLSHVLTHHPVRLEDVTWRQGGQLEIILTVLIEETARETLVSCFDSFLDSLRKAFPQGQVRVEKAPFNSSPHEVFKSTFETNFPTASVKIVMP